MKRSKATSTTAAPEWKITRVALYVDHAVLYANEHQQVRVRAYIEAKNNGDPVPLTPAEIASVSLIDYNAPRNAIPFSTQARVTPWKGWLAQRVYHKYAYHPAAARDGHSPSTPSAGGDYVELYLSADADALAGPLMLGFSVTGDNGWRYRTDGYVFEPGSDEGAFNTLYDTGPDKAVRAEPPILYASSEFVLDRQAGYGHGDAPDVAIFDDIVTVSIVAGGRVVELRSMRCTPAGMIHWIDALPGTRNPCYTGYAEPGGTAITWDDDVPVGSLPKPTLTVAIPGKGTIMLCGRVDIPRTDHGGAPQGPVAVTVRDTYGSEQHCRIGFVAGERDTLKVS